MSVPKLTLQQYCEQLKNFNTGELRYLRDKAKQQINNNIARMIQEEDLTFEDVSMIQYLRYLKIVKKDLRFYEACLHNWSPEQFRNFFIENGSNWVVRLWELAVSSS